MEVRGQDKEKETPSSLGYNRDSSSKVSSTPRSNTTYTVHGDEAIFNPAQTLDHRHPLYHHDHQQLNPPQDIHDRPRRDPDTDPDPVPAASIATESTDRSTPTPTATTLINRYRECLKNHAASMGGHVVDGCGEFMPGGEEGTREALKCAACDCHRNFHRKEIDGASSSQSQLYPVNSYHNKKYPHLHHQQQLVPPPPHLPHPFYQHNNRRLSIGLSNSTPIAAAPVAPLMMAFGGGGAAAEYSSSEDLNIFHSNAGGQSSVMLQQPKYSKKRFRTKFSQEQKDKMMELAEKIGWRIQKEDEKEVQEFCAQVGVKRQVFKVWMHNNKQQAVKKKEM